jgi:trimethylguanosine synthase
MACKQVIAVEIDAARIDMARHNARLYGVDHRIEFICADFFQVAPMLAADCVFLSPPWGGPLYRWGRGGEAEAWRRKHMFIPPN